MNSIYTRANFEYELSKISAINDPNQKLDAFNNYMDSVFISTAKNDVDFELSAVISCKKTSEHLLDFLYTFGDNWPKIKSSISEEKYDDFSTALKYARNSIKYSALKDIDFKLSNNTALNLIKSLELDDQKESFLNDDELSRFEFNSFQAGEILSSYKYDDKKIKFLEEKFDSIHLSKNAILYVINSITYDVNRIKLLKSEFIELFDFSNVDLVNIINHLQKDNSKLHALSLIPKDSSYYLTEEQIGDILSHLNQDRIKLSFLSYYTLSKLIHTENTDAIRTIATKIASSLISDKSKLKVLKPESIKDLNLRNLNVVLIASTLQFDQNKQKIINNADELKLNSKNISRIVGSMNSEKVKTHYLENYAFSPSEKARIISSFENISIIKKYIDLIEIEPFKYAILLGMHDKKTSVSRHDFNEIAKLAGIDEEKLNSLMIPVLPSTMTVGVELETVGLNDMGNYNTTLFREFRTIYGNFLAKRDTSLKGYDNHAGVEIISPVLMNHNLKNLVLVATLLKKNNLGVNDTCGAHIHIGADYLDSVEAWKNLCEVWGNNEDIIYKISSPKGTALRSGVGEYARPISPKIVESIKNGNINLNSEYGLDKLVKRIKYLQYGPNKEFPHMFIRHPELDAEAKDFHKYYGLNFKNINSINKNTIEYRLPNGTLDPQILMNNIRLFTSIVDISKQLGDIEISLKYHRHLTARQKRLYLARESLIKADPENPSERLSSLMNLLFDGNPTIQQIYIDRYTKNSKEDFEKFHFDRFGYRRLYLENADNISEFLEEILPAKSNTIDLNQGER